MIVTFALPSVADFNDMKQKIQAYVQIYDGSVKSYEEMEDVFESLFHEAFRHTRDGRHIDKDQMRKKAKSRLSIGTKADLILFEPLGEYTFEMKLHFVNRVADRQTHLKGTIQDEKLIKIEAYRDTKRARVQSSFDLSELKSNFEHFIGLQNDKEASLNDLQDALGSLFYDSLVAAISRTQLHNRGMRTTSSVPEDFSQAEFTLEKFEAIDKHHIEVKVVRDCAIGDCNSTCEACHDVFTVKDGDIVIIEPYINFIEGTRKKGKARGRHHASCPPVFSR